MKREGTKCKAFCIKRDKRGQFFLVAAAIFVGIFFMLLTTLNDSTKRTNTRINEISQEMKIESSKVLEYSAYMSDDKLGNFTKKYSDYAGKDVNIYFILGNSSSQEAYNYTNGNKENIIPNSFDSGVLNVTIEKIDYLFTFKEGENFDFVIVQQLNGERYILRG